MKSLSCVQLFATPWTVTYQAPFVHGIFQARVLEWLIISSSRGSSRPRDRTWVSCIVGRHYHLSHQWGQRVNLFPPGFELGGNAFHMLGKYDNHYSTERILKWVATSSSKRSSWPRDQTSISSFGRQILYHRAIGKPDFLRERYNYLFSCRMSGCEFPSTLIMWMLDILNRFELANMYWIPKTYKFIDRCHRNLTLTISLFGGVYCTHFTKLWFQEAWHPV